MDEVPLGSWHERWMRGLKGRWGMKRAEFRFYAELNDFCRDGTAFRLSSASSMERSRLRF